MADICTRCTIPGTLMIDALEGTSVCTNCGLVASFCVIDESPEWAIAIDENGHDNRRTGPENNDLLHEQGICVYVSGGFKDRSLSMWNTRNVMNKDKTLIRGYKTINMYSLKLRLRQDIVRACMEVFKKLTEEKMTKSRPHAELVGALVYYMIYALDLGGTKPSLQDIAALSATKTESGDSNKLISCYKAIKHFCNQHFPQYTKAHKKRMQELYQENTRFDISIIERMMNFLNMASNIRRYFNIMLERILNSEFQLTYSRCTILSSVSISFSMFLKVSPNLKSICDISTARQNRSVELYNRLFDYRFDNFSGLGCDFNLLYRL